MKRILLAIALLAAPLWAQTSRTTALVVTMGPAFVFVPGVTGMTEVFLSTDDPTIIGWTVIATTKNGVRLTLFAEAWNGSGLAWFPVPDIQGAPEIRERR